MFALREQKKWNDSLQKAYWSQEQPLGKIVQIDNEYQEVENKFIYFWPACRRQAGELI